MSLTRADLGRVVYDALSLIYGRYTTVRPTGVQAPLTEVVDAGKRYEGAVKALQELSGVRVGEQPTVPAESTQTKVSAINLLVGDIKRFVTPLMKGKDYDILIPSKPAKMRNIVNYKHYDIIATVQTTGKVYMFATNDQGQYILSEKAYWEPL